MSDRDLLDQVEALGADSITLIRRGDGLVWSVHIRYPGEGPSRWSVANTRTIRGGIEALIEGRDPEIEDLI